MGKRNNSRGEIEKKNVSQETKLNELARIPSSHHKENYSTKFV